VHNLVCELHSKALLFFGPDLIEYGALSVGIVRRRKLDPLFHAGYKNVVVSDKPDTRLDEATVQPTSEHEQAELRLEDAAHE
jgi:hypothetical protein